MIRGREDSDSIPSDLIIEILSRLPAKSIVRFFCASKLWGSMLPRPYFTELFLTRSSARPCLLFAVEKNNNDWYFFSSPQPQNPYEKSPSSSSLVVVAAAHFQIKLPGEAQLEFCGHASGLVSFRLCPDTPVICNPSTGLYASLPLPEGRIEYGLKPFLGFDPIDKQFKVLSISLMTLYHDENEEQDIQILTLGTENDSWRKIHCPLNHRPMFDEGICINGVLYYLAEKIGDLLSLIVCFDVRSENFKFIYIDLTRDRRGTKLINYKGKLGVIVLTFCSGGWPRHSLELCMRIIKDAEQPESEWSEYFYTLWEDKVDDVSIIGVTATGEIVLSGMNARKPFYVFYLNPERNTLQSVQIQGFGANHYDRFGEAKFRTVKVLLDHVDLKFSVMKRTYAATSISPPEQKRKPTTTSTSSKAHVEQDGRTFETINKFDYLRL